MKYKNLTLAFIFQAVTGVLSIIAIAVFGGKGLAVITLLALRPLLLEKENNFPDESIWRLYYDILKLSVFFTALTIIFIYFSSILLHGEVLKSEILFISVPPYFLIIHALVGVGWIRKA